MADRNLHPVQFEPMMVPVSQLKRLPSGDFPGMTVAQTFDIKRQDQTGHGGHVQQVKKQGVVKPVHVNTAGVFVDGHHRLAAAADAGEKKVPVVIERA